MNPNEYQEPPQPPALPGSPRAGRSVVLWIFIAGFLGVVGLAATCGGVALTVFTAIKNTPPFQDAVASAQRNPRLNEKLGSPIKPGFFVQGNVKTSNDSGEADLRFPVSGPKGEAEIHVVARQSGGVWEIETLDAEFDGGASMSLLHETQDPSDAPLE